MTHAALRARERYGIQVRPEDFDSIREQIRVGRAIKLGRKGSRTSIYLVTVQGGDAVVVYNRRAKFVITFLPLAWEK
ncbi:MAG: hypothetical protein ACXWPM_01100 [Bdellovibrionota bacterium]